MNPSALPAPDYGKHLAFYFDFTSPYGYFAAQQIEALAARHGRSVRWHAFHMRAVMKDVLGVQQAMGDVPLKGDYVRTDVRRMARQLGVPYAPAPTAGFSSVCAGRMFHLLREHDAAVAARFAHAVFRSHHAQSASPNTWDQCAAIALEAGIDAGWLAAPQLEERGRTLYRDATDAAVAQGVWGTPTFIVDGEMFWGCDRMAQLNYWLQRGGW
ncbi:MAG: 2-hydroxychromene-2-carboxylate isomerase [Pseudomonas sp.]|uniref:2-hydroxychromene-2-carboxylate isomerase n=1 Tax=Pseudomonas sp. TaxID=306 RepID=UPI00121F03ED|nr:DsbA family protein [Pseudomonas sp.]RZI76766.1 MAG: 2-hydroxychromene-2-carboxylate isomerase [Pseudomonas sp.]